MGTVSSCSPTATVNRQSTYMFGYQACHELAALDSSRTTSSTCPRSTSSTRTTRAVQRMVAKVGATLVSRSHCQHLGSERHRHGRGGCHGQRLPRRPPLLGRPACLHQLSHQCRVYWRSDPNLTPPPICGSWASPAWAASG